MVSLLPWFGGAHGHSLVVPVAAVWWCLWPQHGYYSVAVVGMVAVA